MHGNLLVALAGEDEGADAMEKSSQLPYIQTRGEGVNPLYKGMDGLDQSDYTTT